MRECRKEPHLSTACGRCGPKMLVKGFWVLPEELTKSSWWQLDELEIKRNEWLAWKYSFHIGLIPFLFPLSQCLGLLYRRRQKYFKTSSALERRCIVAYRRRFLLSLFILCRLCFVRKLFHAILEFLALGFLSLELPGQVFDRLVQYRNARPEFLRLHDSQSNTINPVQHTPQTENIKSLFTAHKLNETGVRELSFKMRCEYSCS